MGEQGCPRPAAAAVAAAAAIEPETDEHITKTIDRPTDRLPHDTNNSHTQPRQRRRGGRAGGRASSVGSPVGRLGSSAGREGRGGRGHLWQRTPIDDPHVGQSGLDSEKPWRWGTRGTETESPGRFGLERCVYGWVCACVCVCARGTCLPVASCLRSLSPKKVKMTHALHLAPALRRLARWQQSTGPQRRSPAIVVFVPQLSGPTVPACAPRDWSSPPAASIQADGSEQAPTSAQLEGGGGGRAVRAVGEALGRPTTGSGTPPPFQVSPGIGFSDRIASLPSSLSNQNRE